MLAGGAVLAAPASANSQATSPYGTFNCSDGRIVEFFGMPVPHFPTQVGFLDGKGAVARWVATTNTGTLTVLDGAHKGQVIPFDIDEAGPANASRRVSAPDLSTLATCTRSEESSDTFQVDQGTADFLGLDSSYIGANVTSKDSFSLTVWVNPVQLAHR